ncbi:palmitoyltransferase akr1 [Lambiella insularis]|nr:palmitoyltransferase akr1 [Lambiella insularis]
MLLFVQLVQIARATTTYESMSGHTDRGSRASDALTAVLTSGSTTLSGAQLNPVASHAHGHGHKDGYLAQWKKLLGLDTFLATAQNGLDGGRHTRRRQNPFSRGIIVNCKDFWFDPAPIFGKREVGTGMLDGQVVNYARMYETPRQITSHHSRHGDNNGGLYHSIDNGNNV